MQRKGSPHNVVQTVKTTSGNIKLLVPLRSLSKKLKKYMANGQPAEVNAFINQPVDHIIHHYNGVIRGWYNYYQLAENVSSLNYARYILKYSLVKTLAAKERSSTSKIFRKYGKDLTYVNPNGRKAQFFNQPLKQVKRAKRSAADIDALPTWWLRKNQIPAARQLRHLWQPGKRGNAPCQTHPQTGGKSTGIHSVHGTHQPQAGPGMSRMPSRNPQWEIRWAKPIRSSG